MEFSKKFVLVPEDRVQDTEHLSELDQRMKSILQSKDLSEDEKATLYLQVLQKYTYFSTEKKMEPEPELIPPDNISIPVKSEKEDLEEKMMNTVPVRFKDTAKEIYQFLKDQQFFKWNSKGELIYKEEIVPGSNIVNLINDFLRNRKHIPSGRTVFLKALNEVQLPELLDVNKKLYKDNKVVKKKPIMYARKNAWMKL